MRAWYARLGLLVCSLLALVLVIGCAEREHRKMTVIEEQQESEVQEEAPGEMIVE